MENIGQLLMVGFEGTEPSLEFLDFLRDEEIGGVILFARNISSPRQLLRLTETLQDAVKTPLFIAVDHEGGRVFRMPKPFTHVPPARELAKQAASRGSDFISQIGEIMGRELAACGINVNFAPVLDVGTNPFNPVIGDRALSADSHLVAELGVKWLQGLEAAGIMSCGKHFPGHGDTDLDSHLDLPQLNHTRQRFDICEFIPFQAAIAAGVPSLMTAHVRIPLLDPRWPATLSRAIIAGILREEFSYDGLIFTDDLGMQGITRLLTMEEAAVKSLQAGCDVALVCRGFEQERGVLARLRVAATSGEIPAAQLEASLARVRRAKERYCALKVDRPSLKVIGSREHRYWQSFCILPPCSLPEKGGL